MQIIDREDVVAGAALELVGPGAAVEQVIAGTAIEQVVAGVAVELVGAGAAVQIVVALTAVQQVLAAAAVEQIVAEPAIQLVVAGLAEQRVVALVAEDHVIAHTAGEMVVARRAVDHVVAVAAGDMITDRAGRVVGLVGRRAASEQTIVEADQADVDGRGAGGHGLAADPGRHFGGGAVGPAAATAATAEVGRRSGRGGRVGRHRIERRRRARRGTGDNALAGRDRGCGRHRAGHRDARLLLTGRRGADAVDRVRIRSELPFGASRDAGFGQQHADQRRGQRRTDRQTVEFRSPDPPPIGQWPRRTGQKPTDSASFIGSK